jgi:hypothetical protein
MSAAEVRPGTPAAAFGSALRVVAAWLLLALADVALRLAGFHRFHRLVHRCPVLRPAPAGVHLPLAQQSYAAVDRARTYYFKRAWCLQRAAAAVCLLRLRGVPAEMVIGVRKIPFYAHAWGEVDGVVVGDAQSLKARFSEIARC